MGEWICTLAMLLGRLEIFPLLVLVSPQFWRG
jgi:trk system potassium uptake protein TrkH